MRVLINAVSAHMGGSVTYLQNILRWLPEVAPEDRFIVYVPQKTMDRLADYQRMPHIRLETYPYANTNGPARLYFDQVKIPRLMKEHQADALFSSTGFGTFFSPRPQLLLVRNLAYFDKIFQARYRALRRSLKKNTARRWHSLLSISRADLVLFPTRAMRDMVQEYLSLENKHTMHLHYGFDKDAFAGRQDACADLRQKIENWKKEGARVLLSVSTFAVQKNFETLVEALPELLAHEPRTIIVTTLSRDITTDKKEYDAMMRRVKELGVEDHFITLGYVPYIQLHALYQAAEVYVFPSFTESFGHSMVEAMAFGLPVVAADTPVNREVCGDAARYFRTFEPTDCADVLAGVLRHAGDRCQLAENAAHRAEAFSWQRYTATLSSLIRDMTIQGKVLPSRTINESAS